MSYLLYPFPGRKSTVVDLMFENGSGKKQSREEIRRNGEKQSDEKALLCNLLQCLSILEVCLMPNLSVHPPSSPKRPLLHASAMKVRPSHILSLPNACAQRLTAPPKSPNYHTMRAKPSKRKKVADPHPNPNPIPEPYGLYLRLLLFQSFQN